MNIETHLQQLLMQKNTQLQSPNLDESLCYSKLNKVKAVFPIPGLDAIMIKSLGCQPEVNLSNFSKPVLTPLNPSFLEISSILLFA